MASGTCVIIGLGTIGLQLIKMLSKDFTLVCIDSNQDTLDSAVELRGDSLTTIQGDATSRMLLEQAGVAEADTVLITTTTEAVNIEVARILHEHFQVPRVVSIGITQKGIEQLEALGVEVEGIFTVSATGLRNRMEHKTKAVHGIGLGKGEILEVEVHPHSRLANKPLAALHPKSWHVGIVYREGNILIPGGDTILRPKDKVVILGDPKVLRTVTDLLTFRFTLFPLEYGDTLVALFTNGEEERFLEEIAYLLGVFPLKNALFLLPPGSDDLAGRLRDREEILTLQGLHIEEIPPGPVIETLRVVQKKLGRRVAIIVLPKGATVRTSWGRLANPRGKRFLRTLSDAFGCPVLLAGGSFPYARVAVPCIERDSLQHALETTLEMSSAINYQIEALFAGLSHYIGSEDEAAALDQMKKTVSDLGLVYKTSIRNRELQGNPINELTEALAEHNLLVNDIGSWRPGGWLASLLSPDVAWETVRRSPVSTLLIPPMEIIA
jgi:hypothetical protein